MISFVLPFQILMLDIFFLFFVTKHCEFQATLLPC